MKKTIFLLLLAPFIASCAVDGIPIQKQFDSVDCGGSVRGRTDTELKYGIKKNKAKIEMKWKSDVGRGAEFRIVLKPDKGYESKVVKIIGKSGETKNGSNVPYNWLDGSGTAPNPSNNFIVLCVPEDASIEAEYKFDVEIADLGKLDPRAKVTF